jgi:hypothetical protein
MSFRSTPLLRPMPLITLLHLHPNTPAGPSQPSTPSRLPVRRGMPIFDIDSTKELLR